MSLTCHDVGRCATRHEKARITEGDQPIARSIYSDHSVSRLGIVHGMNADKIHAESMGRHSYSSWQACTLTIKHCAFSACCQLRSVEITPSHTRMSTRNQYRASPNHSTILWEHVTLQSAPSHIQQHFPTPGDSRTPSS